MIDEFLISLEIFEISLGNLNEVFQYCYVIGKIVNEFRTQNKNTSRGLPVMCKAIN